MASLTATDLVDTGALPPWFLRTSRSIPHHTQGVQDPAELIRLVSDAQELARSLRRLRERSEAVV